jgi:hypothetical protein
LVAAEVLAAAPSGGDFGQRPSFDSADVVAVALLSNELDVLSRALSSALVSISGIRSSVEILLYVIRVHRCIFAEHRLAICLSVIPLPFLLPLVDAVWDLFLWILSSGPSGLPSEWYLWTRELFWIPPLVHFFLLKWEVRRCRSYAFSSSLSS